MAYRAVVEFRSAQKAWGAAGLQPSPPLPQIEIVGPLKSADD